MDIEKNKDGNKLDIKLIGKLDTAASMELSKSLKEDIDDIEELNFELSDLTYISSSGLRVILSSQKVMSKKGSMKLINPQEIVLDAFKTTGLTHILKIE